MIYQNPTRKKSNRRVKKLQYSPKNNQVIFDHILEWTPYEGGNEHSREDVVKCEVVKKRLGRDFWISSVITKESQVGSNGVKELDKVALLQRQRDTIYLHRCALIKQNELY